MAIRLASAIGQQREPIGILGGLDEAINKTGDTIQADLDNKAAEKAKKADQEQKYKDAIAASTDFTPLVDVHPNDREKDLQFKQKNYNAIMIAAADPKVTRSQLEKMQRDYIAEAQDNKYVMERDWKAIQSVAGKQDDYDTQRFDNLLMKGHTDPTTTAEMPNDDFMAASEADRAGKMPSAETSTDKTTERQIIGVDGKPTTITSTESVDNGNRGMKATETTTSFQGVPYLDRPISERKMININALENELTTLKRPNIVLASKGYFGQSHKFDGYTKATTKISPTTGEIIYDFDEEGADLDARKFATSMIGDGNFGDKSHKQYQRALEYEAMDKGTEAGLSGEKLKNFVEESVAKVAYDDFMQNARAAEMDRIKNDRQVTKAVGKKGGFSISVGNGGENEQWKFGKPKVVNLREGATKIITPNKEIGEDPIKTEGKKGTLSSYEYYSMQTKNPATNPAMIVGGKGGKKGVHFQGVYKKKGSNNIAYFKFTQNADGTGEEVLVPQSELNASTYSDIKTNVGEDDFDKAAAIGNYAPKAEAPSKGAATPKVEAKFATKNKENLDKASELINKYRKKE